VGLIAWGAVRDAITAIHNLEVLLKSPRIGTKVLAEVLHEFLAGVTALRTAFGDAALNAGDAGTLAARKELADLVRDRLDDLERTLQQAMTSAFDARARLALEQVVTRVSVDLDAAAELLDLSDRAERPLETDLALEELAKVTLRGGARGTDCEVSVRLVSLDGEPARGVDRSARGSDRLFRADPHVFKRLVGFAMARVHAAGAAEVSVRMRGGPENARIEVGPTTATEESIIAVAMRLVRRIAPTDAVVEAAARAASIAVTTQPPPAMTVSFEVPRAPQ
jgi:hypothetical protein